LLSTNKQTPPPAPPPHKKASPARWAVLGAQAQSIALPAHPQAEDLPSLKEGALWADKSGGVWFHLRAHAEAKSVTTEGEADLESVVHSI